MNVWFFSDLHLEASPFYKEFLNLLRNQVGPGDRVVLAGDIFDLFVGNSAYFKSKFTAFFETVHALEARGVRFDYLYGNHDFHLIEAFQGTQVRFHEDSLVLELPTPIGLKRIWIEHGDLVDPNDWSYLQLRKIFRSKWMRALTPKLPTSVILGLAQVLSRKHDQQISELPQSWATEDLQKLRSQYRSHAELKHRQGFDYVVMGHCHDLDEVQPFYFNLGYPPVHRQFLHFDGQMGALKRCNFPGISAEN
jgi:UDP-2,3-diacylglucosamine hydrolase